MFRGKESAQAVTSKRGDPESQMQAKGERREGLTVRICFRYLMKEKRTNGC